MSQDDTERVNVEEKHPEVVERLVRLLEEYVAEGRSTPGAPQKNDVRVDMWKQPARPSAAKLLSEG